MCIFRRSFILITSISCCILACLTAIPQATAASVAYERRSSNAPMEKPAGRRNGFWSVFKGYAAVARQMIAAARRLDPGGPSRVLRFRSFSRMPAARISSVKIFRISEATRAAVAWN